MREHVAVLMWSFSTKGITFLLFYALQILLVRRMDVADYGLWSLFYSAFTVALFVSDFGINSSARRYIAEHEGTPCAGAVLSASLKLRALASGICAVVFALIAKPLAASLGQPALAPFFAAAAPMLFLSGAVEYYKSIFVGMRRINYNFLINSLEYGFKLLFGGLLLYYLSAKPGNLISAFTAALLFAACGGYYLASKIKCPAAQGAPVMYGEMLRYAGPIFAAVALSTAMSELDTLVLGAMRGSYEAGLYNAAKQIVIKGPHLSVAIAMGIMPGFARLNDSNRPKMRRLFSQLMAVNTILVGAAALIIALFAGKILLLLYGAKYVPAAPALRLLAVFLLAVSYSVYLVNFLEYQGMAKKIALNAAAAVAVNLCAIFLAVPKFGGVGAALALAAGYAAFSLLCWLDVRKLLYSR